MAARSVLIRDGVEISVETEEELAARSAMGVTSRGDIVLMICSASALQGGVGAFATRWPVSIVPMPSSWRAEPLPAFS